MNILMQVGVGVIPTFIILIVILIFKKRNRRVVIEILFLLFLVGTGSVTAGIYFGNKNAVSEKTKDVNPEYISRMALRMAQKGDVDQARELVNDSIRDGMYSMEYPLVLAKIEAIKGNCKQALLLYRKVVDSGVSVSDSRDELVERVGALETVVGAGAENVDVALLQTGLLGAEFIAKDTSGQDQTIKISDELQKTQQEEEYVNQIVNYYKTLETDGDKKENAYEKLAELVSATENLYQKSLYGGGETTDITDPDREDSEGEPSSDLETIRIRMDELCSEYPDMERIDQTRYAKLKLAVMENDYERLVKNIDENTDYKEFMVIANLYMNGYVTDNSFENGYGEDLAVVYQQVADHLETISERKMSDTSQTYREEIGSYIEDLRNAVKNPVMGQINYQLAEYTGEELNDSSKIYLLMAEISRANGNDSAASEYIDRAMDLAGNCEDSSYAEPMGKLAGLITDKENSEDFKNVSEYVNEVIQNQSVIDMHENLLKSDSSGESEHEEEGGYFNSYFADYVSQKRISLHISDVDISEFDRLKVRFTVDDAVAYSPDDLKEILEVSDCGVDITDFQIEKVNYDRFYTLLCCDTSGSMEGEAIENLRSAVTLFAENKEDKDVLGLVEFNDGPAAVMNLGSSAEDIKNEAAGIEAAGGTNMYDTAISSMDMFGDQGNSLRTIILMSDGADNNPHSSEEIYENIGSIAKQKNIVIYTIGLGQEVDASYLSSIAECTGGSYVYVNDSNSLYEFYKRLNNQNKNQYLLTYQAKDTLTETNRECHLSLSKDELAADSYRYNLKEGEGADGSDVLDGKSIRGLENRLVFKSNEDQPNRLLGTGFVKDEPIRVTMSGYHAYDLHAEYISEEEYALTIPEDAACGTYDIIVQVNGKTAYLNNELTIAIQGSQETTNFGQYKFTSFTKVETPEYVHLSGYVTMNDWLHFNGDVTLMGNLSGENIVLKDSCGSYVKYDKKNSYWLGRFMANHNINMPVMPLEEVTLYNDSGSTFGEGFRVSAVNVATTYVSKLIELDEPVVKLYPDRIEMDVNKFATKLDEQYKLFDGSKEDTSSIFAFEHSEKIVVTGQNLGLNIDIEGSDEEDSYHGLYIGRMPLHFNNKNVEFHLDSVKGTIDFKYIAKLAYLDMDGAGFSIGLATTDHEIKLNNVGFYVDKKINFNIQGVPCSISDFRLLIGDMDKGGPAKWVWTGGAKINAADVASMLPGLEEYVNNVAILTMPDAAIEGRVSQPYLKFSTSFKLLEKFDLGKLELRLGNISYTNALLGMDGEDVKGYVGTLNANLIKWEGERYNIHISADTEVSVHNKFIGIQCAGTGEIDVNWWLWKKGFSAEGQILFGIWKDHEELLNFGIITKEKKWTGKSKDVSLIWNKNVGLKYKNKTL